MNLFVRGLDRMTQKAELSFKQLLQSRQETKVYNPLVLIIEVSFAFIFFRLLHLCLGPPPLLLSSSLAFPNSHFILFFILARRRLPSFSFSLLRSPFSFSKFCRVCFVLFILLPQPIYD